MKRLIIMILLTITIHCPLYTMIPHPDHFDAADWKKAFQLKLTFPARVDEIYKRFPLSKENKPKIYEAVTKLGQESGIPIQEVIDELFAHAAINTPDDLTLFCDLQHPNISAEEIQNYTKKLHRYHVIEERIIEDIRRGWFENIPAGFRINAHSNYGNTILMTAINNGGYEQIIPQLLKQPAIDINAQNNLGETALTKAKRRGDNDIVQLLLQHNALDEPAKDYDDLEELSIHRGRHDDTFDLASYLNIQRELGSKDSARLLKSHSGVKKTCCCSVQ